MAISEISHLFWKVCPTSVSVVNSEDIYYQNMQKQYNSDPAHYSICPGKSSDTGGKFPL